MCFFFCCTPWYKPTPYFKGTCNLGSFYRAKFNCHILKIAMVLTHQCLALKNLVWWKDLCSACKMPSETPGLILFAKPMKACSMLWFWFLSLFVHWATSMTVVFLYTFIFILGPPNNFFIWKCLKKYWIFSVLIWKYNPFG